MKSKWFHLKEDMISLRKQGRSITSLEREFGVARSTLSGWFRNVSLSDRSKDTLENNRILALEKARGKSGEFYARLRKKKQAEYNERMSLVLSNLTFSEQERIIALSFLYYGEGFKKSKETGLGSSDAKMLKFFLCTVMDVFCLKES